MREYNGHRSWDAWNVSLWINNDESLYRMARSRSDTRYYKRADAAAMMLQELHSLGIYKTPDGAPYTVTSIKMAMRVM